jgi:uncharacterized protein YggE
MIRKLGVAAALCLAQALAQAADLPAYPFVHVNGQGAAYAMPEVGEVEFEVSVADADPERARALIDERLSAIRTLLATYSVPDGDVMVRDVRRDMVKGQAQESYRLKCNVRIKVATLASWTAIVSGLLAMPELDEFGVSFDVAATTRAKLESELMAQALRDARKKAADIAAGIGRKLGPANGVSVGEVRNLSRAMGLTAVDFPRHASPGNVKRDRDGLLAIDTIRLGQQVNVIYQLKLRCSVTVKCGSIKAELAARRRPAHPHLTVTVGTAGFGSKKGRPEAPSEGGVLQVRIRLVPAYAPGTFPCRLPDGSDGPVHAPACRGPIPFPNATPPRWPRHCRRSWSGRGIRS